MFLKDIFFSQKIIQVENCLDISQKSEGQLIAGFYLNNLIHCLFGSYFVLFFSKVLANLSKVENSHLKNTPLYPLCCFCLVFSLLLFILIVNSHLSLVTLSQLLIFRAPTLKQDPIFVNISPCLLLCTFILNKLLIYDGCVHIVAGPSNK